MPFSECMLQPVRPGGMLYGGNDSTGWYSYQG